MGQRVMGRGTNGSTNVNGSPGSRVSTVKHLTHDYRTVHHDMPCRLLDFQNSRLQRIEGNSREFIMFRISSRDRLMPWSGTGSWVNAGQGPVS